MKLLKNGLSVNKVKNVTFKEFRNKLNKKEVEKINQIIEKLALKPAWLHSQKVFVKNLKEVAKIVGEGGYAFVLELSEDKVVRIEPRNDYHEYNHDLESPYHHWVTNAVLKTKSKHAPKIYMHGHVEFEKKSVEHKYWITVMEKLEEANLGYDNVRRVACLLRNGYGPNKLEEENLKISRKGMIKLGKIAQENGVSLNDLYSSNVMYRPSDKRIVITDPCSEII